MSGYARDKANNTATITVKRCNDFSAPRFSSDAPLPPSAPSAPDASVFARWIRTSTTRRIASINCTIDSK